MNEMELKPCPFCGGKAKFSLFFLCRDTIVCTECHACIVPPIIGAYSKGELAAEWNGRAEQTEHGRWIPREYDGYADGAPVWDMWECSECGHEHNGEEDTLTEFCPDCGAKMDAAADQGGGADNE